MAKKAKKFIQTKPWPIKYEQPQFITERVPKTSWENKPLGTVRGGYILRNLIMESTSNHILETWEKVS